ncbi:MAG: hypothetical protein DI637_01420 [Citromicrobium sp.]|nr:MAG: hypothetical protein DI637_01420 [Citromicrobium sp.]
MGFRYGDVRHAASVGNRAFREISPNVTALIEKLEKFMLLVCCGMPRSASTLQFNLAWQIVEHAKLGTRVEWRPSSEWEGATDEIVKLAESSKYHVVKMHFPPKSIREYAESSDRLHFVYVHRDIRDVIASMQIKFAFSITHAISRVRDALETEHWLQNGPKGKVLVQEYQLLLTDLSAAMEQLSSFVSANLDDAQKAQLLNELGIDSAYEKSRQKRVPFEHFRRRIGRLLGMKTVFADEKLMLHPNHVSAHKGEMGIWQTALDQSDVELIEAQFGDRIRQGFEIV